MAKTLYYVDNITEKPAIHKTYELKEREARRGVSSSSNKYFVYIVFSAIYSNKLLWALVLDFNSLKEDKKGIIK